MKQDIARCRTHRVPHCGARLGDLHPQIYRNEAKTDKCKLAESFWKSERQEQEGTPKK
jgi:hypothetical protein